MEIRKKFDLSGPVSESMSTSMRNYQNPFNILVKRAQWHLEFREFFSQRREASRAALSMMMDYFFKYHSHAVQKSENILEQ